MVLITVCLIGYWIQQQHCMGVPLIDESALKQYTETTAFDVSQLTFNGEAAAVDIQSRTLYLSQSSHKVSHSSELEGTLGFSDVNYRLFFLKNDALTNMQSTVHHGTSLTLIILNNTVYQKVPVIVSTLPIMNINGSKAYVNEENRDVFSGRCTLWTGFDPVLERYNTQTSALEWHARGNSTAGFGKKSWKLALKEDEGNRHLEFLGLGSDDDWILNSLIMDDTMIREKLFIDLWNTIAADSVSYPMSNGNYTEVVMNGKYLGVFLLQRRVDAKYLGLSDDDVLLKGTQYDATCAQEAYQFVTPAVNTEHIYAIMQRVFDKTDCSAYNVSNMVDTNLLLQFADASDNFSLKNIYHILRRSGDQYEHFLLPWDTDMSFGIDWSDQIGFCLNPDTVTTVFERVETVALKKAHPEYDRLAAERWTMLRQQLLSKVELFNQMDALFTEVNQSGAWTRDKALWQGRYGGNDTIEQMKQFISDRLAVLDTIYLSAS